MTEPRHPNNPYDGGYGNSERPPYGGPAQPPLAEQQGQANPGHPTEPGQPAGAPGPASGHFGGYGTQQQRNHTPVSYTHLTLPTKA